MAVRLGTNDSNWACGTSNPDDGNANNDGKTSGTYYYHEIDRTGPTFTNLYEHGTTESLKSGSSHYIKTYKLNYTVGSEAIDTGGITWDAISGTDKTASDAFDSKSANTEYNMTTDPTLADGTTYNITFEIKDAAGNTPSNTATSTRYDVSAPTVRGVYSEESAGDMLAKDAVADFYVDFSENVNIAGTPTSNVKMTLQYKQSATAAVACHTCTDGSDKAYFNYTVPTGGYSLYLDYAATNSLNVGDGIADLAGNALTATLPTPGTYGSKGANQSISYQSGGFFGIDGAAPAAFQVQGVTTTGGNVTAGYWNGSNTGISVVVPIADDASLTGGTVQLRGEADGC